MSLRPALLALALVAAAAAAISALVLMRADAAPDPSSGVAPPTVAVEAAPRPDAPLVESARAPDAHASDAAASAEPMEPRTAAAPVVALGTVTVRGRLVTPERAAAAGFECLIPWAFALDAQGESRALGNETSPHARARSGDDGAFELALVPPAGTRIASFRFTCVADGRAAIARWTTVAEGERVVELGELVLMPGATVTGFVRDVDGLAIAGARVHVSVDAGNGRWTGDGLSATTDGAGAFRLDHAPSGVVRIAATANDSRASEPFDATLQPGEVRAGIELLVPAYEDPLAVSGTVFDVDGKPLARAPIQWGAELENGSSSGTRATGDDGRFRLQAPTGAKFRVTASHPQGLARPASRRDIAPGTHGIELRLMPQVTVPLRVRGPDGTPVARFTYDVDVRVGTMTQRSAPVDADSATPGAALLVAPSDPFVVGVRAEGYATAKSETYEPDALPVAIEITLVALPEIRGRVVTGGAPVAGARVRAYRALERGESQTKDVFDLAVARCDDCTDATTSADGTFVARVASEGWWHVRVAAYGQPTTRSEAVEVASGRSAPSVLVDVAARGAIEGHVRDVQGAPLARRTVGASCGDGTPVTAVTDADGRYRIEPLAPGGWQVRVLDPDRSARNSSGSTTGPDDAPPIAWDCRVSDGAVTRRDLVVGGG